MAPKQPFKLSLQLEGHNADVRSVAALQSADPLNPLLLSGSRDGQARVWGRPAHFKSKRDLSCLYILEGQAGFVNCCAWAEIQGQVLALAGGQDHLVNAYVIPPGGRADESAANLTPEYMLIGHTDNVCALDVHPGSNGYIVSGSWDKTARVWRNFECVATLAGHEQAVWAVLALDDDLVLTACADKLVRLFSIRQSQLQGEKSKPIATFSGNADAVRGLLRINERLFASCGNDGNIHIFPIIDASAAQESSVIEPIQTLSGHTSFVYSLANLGNNELASAGEDRSVRVWKDGQLQQTITLPAISVWSVASVPNGDILCGSSDGYVRTFTRIPQRLADADLLHIYESAVASQSLNKAQVGDVQKENLPGLEALAQPGKEGQIKMVRNGDIVEAHQYSSATGEWDKIGEVVGGVGSSQKKLHEGKEYDYVFDVDIAEGVPPLKLPYNASENPYVTAQRFLETNELPLTYLDQVVAFIEKNTGAVSIGNSEFVDPYTGASSYRPGGATARPLPLAPSTSSVTAPAAASATSSLLPVRQALTFKQFNAQGAKTKIEEFNSKLGGKGAMNADESSEIYGLLDELTNVTSGKTTSVSASRLKLLKTALLRWPLSERFPLLDAYRVACLCSNVDTAESVATAFEASAWSNVQVAADKSRSTALLLALRASANALSHGTEDLVGPAIAELETGAGNVQVHILSKQARTAYATNLVNLSALVVVSEKRSAAAPQLLQLIRRALSIEAQASAGDCDAEAAYRASIALGNLCVSTSFGSLSASGFQEALQNAQACAQAVKEARLDMLLREIERKSSLT